MIVISKLSTGAILLQQDATDILIDPSAVPSTLGPILLTLIGHGQALGQARKAGHEDGLLIGHARGVSEAEARFRREAEQFAEGLSLLKANAPLAA